MREDEVVGVDFIMSPTRHRDTRPGGEWSRHGTFRIRNPLLGGAAGPRQIGEASRSHHRGSNSAVSFLAPKSCKQVDCPARRSRCSFAAVGAISTPQQPLVVLDGVITGGGTRSDINPRDVEDILVLKGSAASAHYGSRGQAGVIEINDQTRWDEDPGPDGNPRLSWTGLLRPTGWTRSILPRSRVWS